MVGVVSSDETFPTFTDDVGLAAAARKEGGQGGKLGGVQGFAR